MDLGEPGAHLGDECVQTVATLLDELAQPLAFAGAGGDQVFERPPNSV